MGIFIGNLAHFIIEIWKILINVNYYRKKYAALEFYHAFPNSLVILDKYFSVCEVPPNSRVFILICQLLFMYTKDRNKYLNQLLFTKLFFYPQHFKYIGLIFCQWHCYSNMIVYVSNGFLRFTFFLLQFTPFKSLSINYSR